MYRNFLFLLSNTYFYYIRLLFFRTRSQLAVPLPRAGSSAGGSKSSTTTATTTTTTSSASTSGTVTKPAEKSTTDKPSETKQASEAGSNIQLTDLQNILTGILGQSIIHSSFIYFFNRLCLFTERKSFF